MTPPSLAEQLSDEVLENSKRAWTTGYDAYSEAMPANPTSEYWQARNRFGLAAMRAVLLAALHETPTTPALDVEAIRGNCHMTFNGGHQDEATISAFHHGMDTVCNVLADHLKGGFANGIIPQRAPTTLATALEERDDARAALKAKTNG